MWKVVEAQNREMERLKDVITSLEARISSQENAFSTISKSVDKIERFVVIIFWVLIVFAIISLGSS